MDLARRFGALFAAHDPGLGALRRAVRAAIIMPGSFALCLKVIDNPAMAAFAAFGAIATLVLVDFRGTIADRARSQISLVLGCMVLVSLGTLCSRSTVAAVLVMAVLGTVIVFSAVVSSVLAAATTALLLAFILPVSLPGPVSEIPDRIAGWGLSGAISVFAVCLLWPAPAVDPLRAVVVRAARALLACLRAPGEEQPREDARASLAALSRTFLATPYRPTGLTTSARAGVRLVDELQWLGGIILGGAVPGAEPASGAAGDGAEAPAAVMEAAADLLAEVVAVLEHSVSGSDGLTRARDALMRSTRALPERVSLPHAERVAACGSRSDESAMVDAEVSAFASALDPAFRAQEASFMVDQIATNVGVIVAADARSWWERLLGRQPPGIGGPISSVRERAGAHLGMGSVATRNALRAGVALAIAVLASRLLDVEHAFWVSFGTLSILRSNALSTGQTFVRALGGTVLGFLLGALLVLAIGTNTTLLWALLPLAVVIAGVAPAAISFLAGQAAFTVVLFILFNILAPAGWRIGLVRVEDVALGGATSLVVGLLFWPRGAAAAFARALADAYAQSTHYLTTAISQAVICCAPGMVSSPTPTPSEAAAAAAASRRLDDTYRTYLAEQGPKRIGLAGTSMLATGPALLRLAGDAVIALWADAEAPSASRFMAARELLQRARDVEQWYGRFGAGLVEIAAEGAAGGEIQAADVVRLPEPRDEDAAAARRLLATIDGDLRSPDGSATVTAVRIAWTGAFLDAARRLEPMLVATVREAGEQGTLGPGADLAGPVRARLLAAGRRRRGAVAAGRD